MASMNRVFLVGNVGHDVELRHTSSGLAVATVSVATNHTYVDKHGETQQTTEWHRVVVWDKQAEICHKFLSKGRPVFVEGRLQTRLWNDASGGKRQTTEIVANRVQFLGDPRDAAGEVALDESGAEAPRALRAAGGDFPAGRAADGAPQGLGAAEYSIPF